MSAAIIFWEASDVEDFAEKWPCCDIPREKGWAEFDQEGSLIDISNNVEQCQPGGGLLEFIDDLQKEGESCE